MDARKTKILAAMEYAAAAGGVIFQDDEGVECFDEDTTPDQQAWLILRRMPSRILIAAARGEHQATVMWFPATDASPPADADPHAPRVSWLPEGSTARIFFDACKEMGIGPYLLRENRGSRDCTEGFAIRVNVPAQFPRTQQMMDDRPVQGEVTVTVRSDCTIGS